MTWTHYDPFRDIAENAVCPHWYCEAPITVAVICGCNASCQLTFAGCADHAAYWGGGHPVPPWRWSPLRAVKIHQRVHRRSVQADLSGEREERR